LDLSRALRVVLAAGTGLALASCGATTVRKTVVDDGEIKVILRGESKGREPVDAGYQHPATISGTRLAHVLSRIDVREDDSASKDRRAAIPAEQVYDLGDALSKGLALADSSQEIVVIAKRKERRLGIFTEEFLTSFVAYVRDDRLYVHLSRLDWPVPKNPNETIAEPNKDKPVMKFRTLPGEAMQTAGPQGVAVAWRDQIFKQPTAVRVTPEGKIVRRTILMESAPEEPAAAGQPPEPESEPQLTGNLSPDTLRKLADLEEARRAGQIGETEYSTRKREILLADPSNAAPPRTP